jgi:hypothetical protein
VREPVLIAVRRPPVVALLWLVGSLARAQTPAEVHGWLEEIDRTRNAFDEAVITAHAAQYAEGKEQPGAADFDVYTKGRDRALIVFRGGKNAGRKILTNGEKMWLLIPGASNPLPITANQRLMGGASVADVARLRFAEDYTAEARPGTETVEGRAARVLDLTAKNPRSSYPKVVLWYDAGAKRPVKVLFTLPSGKEAKEVVFAGFGTSHGRTTVTRMDIRDLLGRESNVITRLEYRDYKPAKLDDALFTPQGALAFS